MVLSLLHQSCLILSLLLQNLVVLSFSSSEPRGPLSIYFRTTWPSSFPLRTSWFSPLLLQNHMDLYLSTCFRTSWFSHLLQSRVVYSFLQSRMVSSPFTLEPRGLLHSMAAGPRFKSQCPSSFVAPFLTPPTVSYTCQHPCILPALLGCHSKSGQVWPHGVEPIISTLSRRPCNQGELLPSPILGGIWSHPPGSKHGHSYLTHP